MADLPPNDPLVLLSAPNNAQEVTPTPVPANENLLASDIPQPAASQIPQTPPVVQAVSQVQSQPRTPQNVTQQAQSVPRTPEQAIAQAQKGFNVNSGVPAYVEDIARKVQQQEIGSNLLANDNFQKVLSTFPDFLKQPWIDSYIVQPHPVANTPFNDLPLNNSIVPTPTPRPDNFLDIASAASVLDNITGRIAYGIDNSITSGGKNPQNANLVVNVDKWFKENRDMILGLPDGEKIWSKYLLGEYDHTTPDGLFSAIGHEVAQGEFRKTLAEAQGPAAFVASTLGSVADPIALLGAGGVSALARAGAKSLLVASAAGAAEGLAATSSKLGFLQKALSFVNAPRLAAAEGAAVGFAGTQDIGLSALDPQRTWEQNASNLASAMTLALAFEVGLGAFDRIRTTPNVAPEIPAPAKPIIPSEAVTPDRIYTPSGVIDHGNGVLEFTDLPNEFIHNVDNVGAPTKIFNDLEKVQIDLYAQQLLKTFKDQPGHSDLAGKTVDVNGEKIAADEFLADQQSRIAQTIQAESPELGVTAAREIADRQAINLWNKNFAQETGVTLTPFFEDIGNIPQHMNVRLFNFDIGNAEIPTESNSIGIGPTRFAGQSQFQDTNALRSYITEQTVKHYSNVEGAGIPANAEVVPNAENINVNIPNDFNAPTAEAVKKSTEEIQGQLGKTNEQLSNLTGIAKDTAKNTKRGLVLEIGTAAVAGLYLVNRFMSQISNLIGPVNVNSMLPPLAYFVRNGFAPFQNFGDIRSLPANQFLNSMKPEMRNEVINGLKDFLSSEGLSSNLKDLLEKLPASDITKSYLDSLSKVKSTEERTTVNTAALTYVISRLKEDQNKNRDQQIIDNNLQPHVNIVQIGLAHALTPLSGSLMNIQQSLTYQATPEKQLIMAKTAAAIREAIGNQIYGAGRDLGDRFNNLLQDVAIRYPGSGYIISQISDPIMRQIANINPKLLSAEVDGGGKNYLSSLAVAGIGLALADVLDFAAQNKPFQNLPNNPNYFHNLIVQNPTLTNFIKDNLISRVGEFTAGDTGKKIDGKQSTYHGQYLPTDSDKSPAASLLRMHFNQQINNVTAVTPAATDFFYKYMAMNDMTGLRNLHRALGSQ